MFKFVTAGVTAIALTLSSVPAQARGLSEDDIGKLLFGLVAAGVISTAINNNQRRTVTVTPQVTEQSSPRRDHSRNRANILPRACLARVETRIGTQRILGRNCLRRNDVNVRNLPRDCAVRLRSNGHVRRGFDPQCLRDAGFRTQRL